MTSEAQGRARDRAARIARSVTLASGMLVVMVPSHLEAAELTAGDASSAKPLEFHFGDATVLTKGTVTYGTIRRADARDPSLVPPGNAARVGVTGTAVGGTNNDDGDLNYARGDTVSTVLKGIVDADVKYRNFGAFLRVSGWDDFAQEQNAVPFGNLPNGYTAGVPLSDSGFSAFEKFSGLEILNANVYGNFNIDSHPLYARFGYQTIDWGAPGTILGGLEQIDPINNPARLRAGAVPEETRIPIPALFGRLGINKQISVEAFFQFKFRPNELPGCGTFSSFVDYATPGCNQVYAAPATVSDPQSAALGYVVGRAPDVKPGNGGEYGLGATYLAEGLGQFGLYFANYDSRRLAVSVIKSSRTSFGGMVPLYPGNADGENVRYFVEYPEDIKVWGLTFKTRLPDQTRVFAEYTYRPNQTIQLATTDLLYAFVSPTAPSELRADASATPFGGVYHGYDRLRMSQFSTGAAHPMGKILGGDFTLSGEVGFKYIHDLPDVNVRRYVRSDIYGLGPVDGLCLPGAPSSQCSNAGYATAFSWGYRLKISSRYTDVAQGLDITPSITFADDVKGWSYDGFFTEGRKLAIVALRGDLQRRFFAEALWTPIWGGDYNFLKDRSFYALAIGATF